MSTSSPGRFSLAFNAPPPKPGKSALGTRLRECQKLCKIRKYWILHWDCYNKNMKWIISRQRAKSVQHHNKRWLKPMRGLPGLCLVSTVAILKPSEKTWKKHKTSAGETMPRLRGFMGYWYLYLWDSSEGLFSLLVFLPIGVLEIFCQGGR